MLNTTKMKLLVTHLKRWLLINHSIDIGVVITASHNPIEDNGIKIISHTGHMMSTSLEGPLATFVNDPSLENAFTEMQKLLSGQFKTEPLKPEVPGLVFVGYDTRPSSPRLFDLLL